MVTTRPIVAHPDEALTPVLANQQEDATVLFTFAMALLIAPLAAERLLDCAEMALASCAVIPASTALAAELAWLAAATKELCAAETHPGAAIAPRPAARVITSFAELVAFCCHPGSATFAAPLSPAR